MKKRSGLNPCVRVDAAGAGVVSQAGAVVLVETARTTGLDRDLSQALGSPTAVPQADSACETAQRPIAPMPDAADA